MEQKVENDVEMIDKQISDHIPDAKFRAHDKTDRKLQYMLSELSMSRSSLDKQIQRFDQLVTFYLTGATAIGGGIVLVSLAQNAGLPPLLLVGFFFIIFTVFGTGTFMRMCSTKVAIAVSYSRCLANRLFFFKQFQGIEQYVVFETSEQKYEIWRIGAFSRQAVFLLSVISVMHGASFAIGISFVLHETSILIDIPIGATWMVVLFIFFFLVATSGNLLFLKGQMEKAKERNRTILSKGKVDKNIV